MKQIEFSVLWWDEGQSALNDLGVRPDVTQADTRVVTFYTINNISPYSESGKKYTALRSAGEEYIIPIDYERVKGLIDEAFTSK